MAPGALLAIGLRDPREQGLAGEILAARWLAGRGFCVLGRRVRTSGGEFDLVVLDGEVLVAIEVKTGRRGPRWSPGLRVGSRRLRRLSAAVRALSRRLGRRERRVDLVEVCLDDGARRPILLHHRDLRRPLAGPPLAD
ncbi:MAG: YraN family protein [Planctomycetota bacterium]